MRIGAIGSAAVAFGFLIIFTFIGIDERFTLQQVVLMGTMLGTSLICISLIEK